ncbi:sugar phosphate isomerase/epimerase [Glutamicibacter halophytocola]|uniref:sugar phosphate isomerase/epimerase family protein n=1 Tax=Glutamicibacter halophytocola TaxID=1933880 RepID=UPI003219BB18
MTLSKLREPSIVWAKSRKIPVREKSLFITIKGNSLASFRILGRGELTSAWELLAEFTDPRYVTFELDVLWAADAGVDVVQLLSDYGERVELLHVKDGFLNGDERAVPTDLGEGELEWTPILDAAQKQVEYFIVERDLAPSTAEFARDSFEFLSCYTC